MAAFITKLYRAIIDAGVSSEANLPDKIRMRTLNSVYIFCAAFTSAYIFAAFFQGNKVEGTFSLVIFILCLLVPILHHYRYFYLVFVVHLLVSGVGLVMLSSLMGFYSGFQLMFLCSPLSVLVFFGSKNWKVAGAALVFYMALFGLSFALHHYGYDHESEYHTVFFMVNAFLTALIILILARHFANSNEAYANQLREKNELLVSKNAEVLQANTELMQSNAKINVLVSELNDKVKNNLQVMNVFAELDRFEKPTEDFDLWTKLNASRLRILEVAYQMMLDPNLSRIDWFPTFALKYFPFFIKNYAPLTHIDSSIVILQNADLALTRKKFDGLVLLLNEIAFQLIARLTEPTMLDMKVSVSKPTANSYIVQISIGNYPYLPMTISKNIARMADQQHIDMGSEYFADTQTLSLTLTGKIA